MAETKSNGTAKRQKMEESKVEESKVEESKVEESKTRLYIAYQFVGEDMDSTFMRNVIVPNEAHTVFSDFVDKYGETTRAFLLYGGEWEAVTPTTAAKMRQDLGDSEALDAAYDALQSQNGTDKDSGKSKQKDAEHGLTVIFEKEMQRLIDMGKPVEDFKDVMTFYDDVECNVPVVKIMELTATAVE
jgi:hypothetical protein